ncbi:SCF E3 ubiquitin ligase complex F-box protein grrA [Momordica charantia]|uniref:SCF E3 ubiquitin ligase complex F-box protein grrA n=1 Tax=Momordica charantia TaxID=3673 RepID=A0A6J1CTK7_MOMCH|nr:SCF E3 ubiquitin ligase complex F-box protein grrA [Momordica charantia]
MEDNFASLPEECWELIFSFLLLRRHGHHFESLSLVCKQFFSITNKLRIRFRISELTVPVLPRIYSRFRQIKKIDLQNFKGALDGLLVGIAGSGLDVESLDISNQKRIPVTGLMVLGSKMRNLRVLLCSKIGFLPDDDLVVIARSFPNLEELDISYPKNALACDGRGEVTDLGIFGLVQGLPRLCKVNLSGNSFISDKSLLDLSTNCVWLKEIAICDCDFITQSGIAKALRQSPNLSSISANWIGIPSLHPDLIDSLKILTSLNLSESLISDELLHSVANARLPLKKLILSHCHNFSLSGISLVLYKNLLIEWLDLEVANFLTDESVKELSKFLPLIKFINLSNCSNLTCSSLFSLARNCPALTEVKMKNVNLEKDEDYTTDLSHPQLMSLDLSGNRNLCNEGVGKIASIFPNLELLKLNHCAGITEEGIGELLRVCNKIRHLELNFCTGIKNLEMDFEVSAMEALRLQRLAIEDSTLAVIGRRCPSLIHLDLLGCSKVTAEGVKEVVRNCRRLREINLWDCCEIDGSILPWMVFSRPSLREIMAPNSLLPTDNQRDLFLRHGCLVFNDGSLLDLNGISYNSVW